MSISSAVKKVLAKPPEEECRSCLFFYFRESPAAGVGFCHRYPEPRQSPASYWCGEWKLDPDEANHEKS
jgi:hypothetical protein